MSEPLSVPARRSAPRPLDESERAVLGAVADVLIPAQGAAPAASGEPGFDEQLRRALDARADAFDAVVAALHRLRPVPADALFARLEALDAQEPDTFQALSTVIAGAWLLTPGVRERIGYSGLRVAKAGLEDAADDLGDGLLDPVLARAEQVPARWLR
jgi:hypothetical protein